MKKFANILLIAAFAIFVVRPALADDAEALYKSKCQVCHGPDGKGSAAGQKLGVKDFHAPDVVKQSETRQGKNAGL